MGLPEAQLKSHEILARDQQTRFLMKKVLINVEERELRVAILEDDQLVELYIESLDEKSILNNIYKGRIEDVLPGLKAAFVNIGLDRNAFLHFDDVRPDLLWGKYRELNPEMADEVPTAREALAAPPEGETEDETDDRRKRRRGRRGGKKRRPDAEETYTPGLPVGVTEDDLEDEEDEEHEIAAAPARPAERYERPTERYERPETARPVPAYTAPSDEDADEETADDIEISETPAAAASEGAPVEDDEAARRQAARMEKQRQRRERWEQKKLERQQRRQAQRAERQQQGGSEPEVEAPLPAAAPTAYGTRGSSHATDSFAPLSFSGQQRRSAKQLAQDKARYGDNFGNIAVRTQQRHDYRDSQADFFGPSVQTTEDHHSIWDDRQPDLGPVPGLDVGAMLGFENYHRRQRGSQHRRQGSSATGQHRSPHHNQQGQGQGQGQNKKRFNKDNKRRGGKNVTCVSATTGHSLPSAPMTCRKLRKPSTPWKPLEMKLPRKRPRPASAPPSLQTKRPLPKSLPQRKPLPLRNPRHAKRNPTMPPLRPLPRQTFSLLPLRHL